MILFHFFTFSLSFPSQQVEQKQIIIKKKGKCISCLTSSQRTEDLRKLGDFKKNLEWLQT